MAQKTTPQELVDAPDPQEAESGRERQRLVQFSISAQKATPQGLVDAPDPQEAESGRERQRLVRFSIFWSQMITFGYVPRLDYAGLKNLNVWSLRTPLMGIQFFQMSNVMKQD